ncbi:alpha/beta fold hydrolase [Nonomuraea pusilla]
MAPLLASSHTVICPDLRGYGRSGKPPTTPDHAPYSKRAMARDLVALARALGHERFAVAGHDRGAYVAHRPGGRPPGRRDAPGRARRGRARRPAGLRAPHGRGGSRGTGGGAPRLPRRRPAVTRARARPGPRRPTPDPRPTYTRPAPGPASPCQSFTVTGRFSSQSAARWSSVRCTSLSYERVSCPSAS